MYVPGSAARSGCDDQLELIPEMAFVHCDLTGVKRHADSWAWISVTVEEVVPIPEFERRFPARTSGLPTPERHQSISRTRYGDGEMIRASSVGDLGAWFLALHKRPKVHLVAGPFGRFTKAPFGVAIWRLPRRSWNVSVTA